MILCGNPHAQYLAHQAEIDAAVQKVLKKGWYILGEEVKAFEEEFAAFNTVKHAIGVGSGTDALHLALVACGVRPGDEVITVSHTAVATVSAIELAGGKPVFVDIDPETYTLDPSQLELVISEKTKAIIAVHLYGQSCDMDPILVVAKKFDLKVIEDCAQAHGAQYKNRRVGALGDMGCFSFYPTKNLGALGDGGMVVTQDSHLAEQVRLLREYGWKKRYVSNIAGWNSRLDELQAAVLRVKLRKLEQDNARRSSIAHRYHRELTGSHLILPTVKEDRSHVYHLYVIRSKRRDDLMAFLQKKEIAPIIHYPVPIHCQPAYLDRCGSSGVLKETERAAMEVLSLPIYPELMEGEVDQVIGALKTF